MSDLAPKRDIPVDEITDLMTIRKDTGEASHTNKDLVATAPSVGLVNLVSSK
jgi:hypothetical protein